ncbi:hypothetical protein [Aquaspirillum serpens]|nr:hypothetical protein [Aquaspirillum serpens]
MADFICNNLKLDQHEIHSLIRLIGIESPGLTTRLAIVEAVAEHD